eukprot:TRINITY_DN7372_c0_g1_i1.p1 TRINITY_DN7372_c0_g1~~TRINITY_DN7372_c0_g1_i1.p1  ORF type:complete len:330 (+),score=84.52 TRINITY_DN7372_c0_g1_i1:61-990(+)
MDAGGGFSVQALVQGLFLAMGAAMTMTTLIKFVKFELQVHRFDELKENKFVKVTVLAALALFVEFVLLIFFVALPAYSVGLFKTSVLMFIIMSVCHVLLVYLRSRVVFSTSEVVLRVMRILGLVFVVSLLLVIVEYSVDSAIRMPLVLVSCSVALVGMTYVAIDVGSTVLFGLHVNKVNSAFKENGSFISESTQINATQTDTIASRGFVICAVSSVNVIMFWIALLLTSERATMPAASWVYLTQKFLSWLVVYLWMKLKIELDTIANRKSSAQLLLPAVEEIQKLYAQMNKGSTDSPDGPGPQFKIVVG